MTVCPWACSIAATVEESTPPDMAIAMGSVCIRSSFGAYIAQQSMINGRYALSEVEELGTHDCVDSKSWESWWSSPRWHRGEPWVDGGRCPFWG